MVENLIQWLAEQLDEDKRIARRAGDSFRQIGETGVIVATEGGRAEECASANWAGIAEHIVRHDPARVLREIDAKQQIVRWHYRRPAPKWDVDGVEGFECATCDQQFPCLTLRLLALPYADRPGYREEWRP